MEINKIQNYQYFFGDQVREIELEQRTLVKSPICQLVKKEELTLTKIKVMIYLVYSICW